VRSPIGKPLPHLTIDVRGEDLAPVAVGESGELWIAGAGVAAGYLDRPELTAQRFVTLDTPAGPRRYYRTGDLARVLPDGELEFLGRNDQQVKLRGFRVELGEIEATLRAHDAVRDVAATVITTAAGAQFLVACVVSAGDPVPDGAELAATLRAHARTGLPAHMVPDRYVVVPALPLTPSGKLDRGALPALARPARAVSPRR
jgi:acyl-coenzyme A synthetase/AMP-(fatty) acid ligase